MIGKRQTLRQQHRVLKDTVRLVQFQIDHAVAGGYRIEQRHGIDYTIGAVNGVRSFLPMETGSLAVCITKRIGLGLIGSTERFEFQVIISHGLTGSASRTQAHAEITTLNREVKRRRYLVGPTVIQTFYIPLITLDLVFLTDERITRHVVDLLYPGTGTVKFHLIGVLAAVHDDLRPADDRDRVGSQSGSIEGEETGTVLHEHTIDYIEAVIVHTGVVLLAAT